MIDTNNPRTVTSLQDLSPHPRNARRHSRRNVEMIAAALGEVGAARSIVIDESGIVLAGSATLDAADRAGIQRVQVVEADGSVLIAVRRTGLTDEQKARLSLYDNRAAELATWDDELLNALVDEGVDLSGLWTPDELKDIIVFDTAAISADDALALLVSPAAAAATGPAAALTQDAAPAAVVGPAAPVFREYDESIARTGKQAVCPQCGHEFPV